MTSLKRILICTLTLGAIGACKSKETREPAPAPAAAAAPRTPAATPAATPAVPPADLGSSSSGLAL